MLNSSMLYICYVVNYFQSLVSTTTINKELKVLKLRSNGVVFFQEHYLLLQQKTTDMLSYKENSFIHKFYK